MGNTSQSLKALEACSQPSSLSPGLAWESWLDDLTGVIWDLSFMVPGVSLPPPAPWATECIRSSCFFSRNCLFCRETVVSLSCPVNMGLQLSAKLSWGGPQVRGCHPFCCFHTFPGQDRASWQWLQEHSVPAFLKEDRSVECSYIRGSWYTPLDSEFSVVLVEIFVIPDIRSPFFSWSWLVNKLCMWNDGKNLENWALNLQNWAVKFGK